MGLQYKGEEVELLNRLVNLLGKVTRQTKGAEFVANSKELVTLTIVYFNRTYPDMIHNCLRVFHSICKLPDFASLCSE